MTKLEYLKFLDQGCPYSMNGKCELCNELSIRCDGERFIHCYEFEHSEIGKEVNIFCADGERTSQNATISQEKDENR